MKGKICALFGGAAVAVCLSAAPSFAAAPNGSFVWNNNANSQGNCVGVLSSRIIQNGQFVSGNGAPGFDQTTSPGSRADLVHAAQDGSC
jgi:hypothetical protein